MKPSTKHMLREKLDGFGEILNNEFDLGYMTREEFVPLREKFRDLYLALKQDEPYEVEKVVPTLIDEDEGYWAVAVPKGYKITEAKLGLSGHALITVMKKEEKDVQARHS